MKDWYGAGMEAIYIKWKKSNKNEEAELEQRVSKI